MKHCKLLLLVICHMFLLSGYLYSQTDRGTSCLVNNGFCDFKLCDTCTLPSYFATVTKDQGINYGKYYHSSTYPGDVT